ncbi:MAG: magnesium/cobalt transporter CorA, partial [archaeon]|nr:magnesium/cobalt transporter CorA [archaeon]
MRDITSAQLPEYAKKGFVWVDVERPSKEEFDLLQKTFPLHPLACDPVFEAHIRAKFIDFEKHLLLIFHEPLEEKGHSFARIIIFVGKNFLVTVHPRSLPSIDSMRELAQKNPELVMKGSSFLTYHLLDRIVDNYFPILDDLDYALDDLEKKIFVSNGKQTLKEVFRLKRQILELRKMVSPGREVLASLARHDSTIISKDSILYFRDVYDHIIRISDTVDGYRDLLTSVLDVYISVQSNRMNDVMKVLTVIATVMLPLTLIVGFYGMNITFPEVGLFGENTYYFILA